MPRQNRNFNPFGKCSRCPRFMVPVSWLNGWKCAECFEAMAESQLGSCLLVTIQERDQMAKWHDSVGAQDEQPPRLKGYRKQ